MIIAKKTQTRHWKIEVDWRLKIQERWGIIGASMNTPDIELLAPAGSFETALAAFAAGANAVYLGLNSFSARAEAVNFSPDELRDLLAYAHSATPRRAVYVTFNTVLDEDQLPQAVETLALLDELEPDGLIVQDLGVARLVHRHFPHLALHASTQLVAHNLEGVLALKELGFVRVVLARELPLEDIHLIAQRSGVEIEVFVHGALCYSLSGLCLFSAMEKNRSGNRGKCAYCCRLGYADATGARSLPFSMRDLRLDESLNALRDAGVASLKIEGRMKSALYVSTVTSHYRQLLDGVPVTTTRADLETVFSRRTTPLYINGYPKDNAPVDASPIDPSSLGHLGTPIGTIKRLTKDREGRTWLRVHTNRALERHDGLQFQSDGGKPFGFGITDMRVALSRTTVFSVRAGSDVEILVPDNLLPHSPSTSSSPSSPRGYSTFQPSEAPTLHSGVTVYCSASNEVKRRFPVPSFRPSDYSTGASLALTVTLTPAGIDLAATCANPELSVTLSLARELTPSQHPERTEEAVHRAFARLGGTNWSLGALTILDADHLFAPASVLNDLRRALVEKLDALQLANRAEKVAAIQSEIASVPPCSTGSLPVRVLKMRLDQPLPEDIGDYDELVIAVGHRTGKEVEAALQTLAAEVRVCAEEGGDAAPALRLALPVFTREHDFNALRSMVKHMVKAGISAWEAADLATLRLLRQLGLADITADWTLYAFNSVARAALAELGLTRLVLSPENSETNLQTLASLAVQSPMPGYEFLQQQSTPLFISLTRPETEDPAQLTGLKGDTFTSFLCDGLWLTTRPEPRRFRLPGNVQTTRVDISWDPA